MPSAWHARAYLLALGALHRRAWRAWLPAACSCAAPAPRAAVHFLCAKPPRLRLCHVRPLHLHYYGHHRPPVMHLPFSCRALAIFHQLLSTCLPRTLSHMSQLSAGRRASSARYGCKYSSSSRNLGLAPSINGSCRCRMSAELSSSFLCNCNTHQKCLWMVRPRGPVWRYMKAL